MTPDILNFLIEQFLVFWLFLPFGCIIWVLLDILEAVKNKVLNRKAGLNRKLKITLTVNEIYLIKKSLCFRSKVMDDYSSHHSYELVDKLNQVLFDSHVPFDLKKIGFRDYYEDL